jgi:hypothetical protein
MALGVILLLTTCERQQHEEFKPQLMVHCMLLAGTPDLAVSVNRTYRIDEPFDTAFPGANMVVWRGQDTWQLAHWHRDYYYRRLDSGQAIAPHDTFHIRVAKEGFDTVYGRTVVPDTFTILYPAWNETVTLTDSMGWTRSRGAQGYYMSLERRQGNQDFFLEFAIPNDSFDPGYDSTRVNIQQMLFLYGGRNYQLLTVYAADSNYYDWVSGGGFGAGGSGRTSHLVGGVGVFGSGCVRSVSVYYEPDTLRPGH